MVKNKDKKSKLDNLKDFKKDDNNQLNQNLNNKNTIEERLKHSNNQLY